MDKIITHNSNRARDLSQFMQLTTCDDPMRVPEVS